MEALRAAMESACRCLPVTLGRIAARISKGGRRRVGRGRQAQAENPQGNCLREP